MEFPFGHHHHHRDEEGDPHRHPPPVHQPYGRPEPVYPPPPPGPEPYYGAQVRHVAHEVRGPSPFPYPPPPGYGSGESHHHHPHHHHLPHGGPAPPPPFPAPVQHVSHESWASGPLAREPIVRVFTKAEENYSLSIRDGKVILARSNHRDPHQHWIKDMRYSTKVKDEEGFPAFALINKVTGEALKHSIGATHPVRLIRYNPDYLDESVLWAESRDVGDGFRCIRMVNNIRLNFDAFHGDEDHGGVHDGTTLVLWEWLKGKNQRWKIVPYCVGGKDYPPYLEDDIYEANP